MTIPNTRPDREFDAFDEASDGRTVRRVNTIDPVNVFANFSIPFQSKCYTFEQTISGGFYLDIWKFYESGTPIMPVNLLRTVTIYYSDRQRTTQVGGVSE